MWWECHRQNFNYFEFIGERLKTFCGVADNNFLLMLESEEFQLDFNVWEKYHLFNFHNSYLICYDGYDGLTMIF